MRRHLAAVMLIVGLTLAAGCTSATETTDVPAAATNAADPLTGMWKGTWGPSAQDRNDVTLDLKWDGSNLSGTVNPEGSPIALTAASYDPSTGAVHMEASAPGRNGEVHYMIDGKVEGSTMSGSWSHDERKGDFAITKS